MTLWWHQINRKAAGVPSRGGALRKTVFYCYFSIFLITTKKTKGGDKNQPKKPDLNQLIFITLIKTTTLAILNTIRQERRRFHKTWLDDASFCNWLVYTQIAHTLT